MNEVKEGILKITLTGTERDAVVADPGDKTVRGIYGEVKSSYWTAENGLYNGYRSQPNNRSATESKKHDR